MCEPFPKLRCSSHKVLEPRWTLLLLVCWKPPDGGVRSGKMWGHALARAAVSRTGNTVSEASWRERCCAKAVSADPREERWAC